MNTYTLTDAETTSYAEAERCLTCECGECTGERCQWVGSPDEMVTVEYMPEQHRASHEAGGNGGAYPHNGAIRVRCAQECAEWLVESDADWAQIVCG